ncbi:hypothetical protein RKD28_001124 [Streptomyces sp. SAI-229]
MPLGDRHDLLLESVLTGLREPGGDQYGVRDPLASHLLQRRGHEPGGDREDRHIHLTGNVGDTLVRLAAENVIGPGVHRMDLPGEAAVDEVAHHRVADLAGLVGGPDHRHRARPHQPSHGGEDLLARVAPPLLRRPGGEDHADVGGDRSVRRRDHRVEVDLGDLREVRHQVRHPPDLLGEGPPVHALPAAHPAQDLRRPDRVQHRQRLVGVHRRQPERDVLEHLDEHPAEPERHHLPERRIGDRADDDLLPLRQQLLHLHALDPGAGGVRAGVLDDPAERRPYVRGALHTDDHTAGVGLVQDVRRHDLHHHGPAEPRRARHGLVDVRRHLLTGYGDPVRVGDHLALGRGERTAPLGAHGVEQRAHPRRPVLGQHLRSPRST